MLVGMKRDGNDNCGSDLIVTPSGLEIQGTAREQTESFFLNITRHCTSRLLLDLCEPHQQTTLNYTLNIIDEQVGISCRRILL